MPSIAEELARLQRQKDEHEAVRLTHTRALERVAPEIMHKLRLSLAADSLASRFEFSISRSTIKDEPAIYICVSDIRNPKPELMLKPCSIMVSRWYYSPQYLETEFYPGTFAEYYMVADRTNFGPVGITELPSQDVLAKLNATVVMALAKYLAARQ